MDDFLCIERKDFQRLVSHDLTSAEFEQIKRKVLNGSRVFRPITKEGLTGALYHTSLPGKEIKVVLDNFFD